MGVQPHFSFAALARFADNLYRARERADLNQRDAAEKAGISHFWLDRIEGGESVPPLDVGVKLAVAYSTSVSELLAGITWRPPAIDGPLRGEYVVAEDPATVLGERRSVPPKNRS
jgi:transcriptional regulator with XRE-family HTH domain